jgi:hypothetical protein
VSHLPALVAAVLSLVLAVPAAAGTVAQRTPEVGPAFAGELVAWGEETRSGAALVLTGAPGRSPQLIHRIPPATARDTTRGFMGYSSSFGASATAFAALTFTATTTSESVDSVSTAYTIAAIGGPLAGPARTFAGCRPERGDEGCGDVCDEISGIDVDGDRIALARAPGPCGGDAPRPPVVTVHQGDRAVTIPAGGDGELRHVRIAGRHVAWIRSGRRGGQQLVVHDLELGAAVTRIRSRALGARYIDDAALQDDGTVALTFGGLANRRGITLGVATAGTPGVRVLDRHADNRGVAVAAGRVLYERVVSEMHFRGALMLRSLGGGPARRLARFPERRRRVGGLDLDATRATWAARPFRRGYDPRPRGPARIVVRDL